MNDRETYNWEELRKVISELMSNHSNTPVTHAELSDLLTPLFEVIQDMRPETKVDD